MTALSVNLNKIALIRNSREGNNPDILCFAIEAIEAGAQGITVHPRPDQRHIRPSDVQNISDITNSIMEYTEKDTVWLLIEHDGEDDWIQRWFDTHDIKPQVYKRSYTEQEKWTHRDSTVGNGQGHHLIIWKQ